MTTTTYVSATDTAKRVRKALKQAFPDVKFSVRTDKYAGGGSILVGYTDGPTETAVERVAKQFEGSHFDGMIDLKSPVTRLVDGQPVHYLADFVFVTRGYADETFQWARDVAVRGSYWWPEGVEFETWGDAGRYAARDLLAGLDLIEGVPEDARDAFRDRWER